MNTEHSTNPFDAPPAGATPLSGYDRPLSIEYRSGKIPQGLAGATTSEWMQTEKAEGRLGLVYYDKEQEVRRTLPAMTFILLEVYAGVSGYDKENKIKYWSNRVKDTRFEPMRIYCSASKGPIAVGLYAALKNTMPADAKPYAKYHKFAVAYCRELDKVVEIEMSAQFEFAMQKGIARADAATGRKTNWEKVFTLGLCDNDHIWGFYWSGEFTRAGAKGEDYDGKGDLYFQPVVAAGLVTPTKYPDIHAKCVDLQMQERERYKAFKAKDAAEQAAQAAPAPQQEAAPAPPDLNDDLPF